MNEELRTHIRKAALTGILAAAMVLVVWKIWGPKNTAQVKEKPRKESFARPLGRSTVREKKLQMAFTLMRQNPVARELPARANGRTAMKLA